MARISRGSHKTVLLTATPLHNRLEELFGLVSIFDPEYFYSLNAFRERYVKNPVIGDHAGLAQRVATISKRTLRKDADKYIHFTERLPLTVEFMPSPEEIELYDAVNEYLQRDTLWAFSQSQRHLAALIVRKRLGSSTFAVASTLERVAARLRDQVAAGGVGSSPDDDRAQYQLQDIGGRSLEPASHYNAPASLGAPLWGGDEVTSDLSEAFERSETQHIPSHEGSTANDAVPATVTPASTSPQNLKKGVIGPNINTTSGPITRTCWCGAFFLPSLSGGSQLMPTRRLTEYHPTRFMAEDSTCDKRKADYAVAFIEALKHTEGRWAGENFDLIDWQERIIRDLFGTVKAGGHRQFTTAYVEIPKKQGESELAAAIALLLTCADGEERAEVYGCAADRQQASIVFEVAADMICMSPALAKRVKILSSQKRIVYKPTNSFYQVLSAEAYSKHGFNIFGVVFDELHAQPNRALFDVTTKGSGDARTQPLYFLITTAGTDTHSICFEQHQKALDLLAGKKHDPAFYPLVYGAATDDDWTAEATWLKANPSLGITVPIEKVRAACESAKQNAAEENTFR